MTDYVSSPPRSQTVSTWRQQADGHQQHMLLLSQVELLQADLELHQRLQQLQSVSSYGGRDTSLMSAQHVETQPYFIKALEALGERYHPCYV